MNTFADKVAIVTGAGSGIGRAAAIRLSSLGANVVVADINGGEETVEHDQEPTEEARRSRRTDVREPADIQALVESTVADFGRLDLAFNNAGIAQHNRKPLARARPRHMADASWTPTCAASFSA